MAEIETIVSGDTLIVRPIRRDGFHFTFGGRRERVTIHIPAAMLASLKMNGSGDVDLQQFSAINVKLAMSGPGDVSLSGTSGELTAEMSGSGDLTAAPASPANSPAAVTGVVPACAGTTFHLPIPMPLQYQYRPYRFRQT